MPVGVAPYAVVLVGEKAYVSNWGGRRPDTGDLTGPAASAELLAGLHASALAVSPNNHNVVCANAGNDTLTAFDTRTDRVVETIWVKPKPSDLFGASPNALVFDPSGRRLYVANGTQNAVAVVNFDPADRESKLAGLVPVGWFPGSLVFDGARHQLDVANIKGHPIQTKSAGSAAIPPCGGAIRGCGLCELPDGGNAANFRADQRCRLGHVRSRPVSRRLCPEGTARLFRAWRIPAAQPHLSSQRPYQRHLEAPPTPAACQADNDLAFGRIVEALSHSPFWKDTAIFAIEDDPQAGWDHVSGYRTTAYVASPYAKRGAVVSTQYNTTSLLRTLGQILGMKPMNQFDASAVPMWDAFTDTPDPTPFIAVPNNIPSSR